MDDNGLLHWLVCSGFMPSYDGSIVDKWPCEKKLLKHNINDGHIEVKCHRCSTTNVYHKTLGETNEPI